MLVKTNLNCYFRFFLPDTRLLLRAGEKHLGEHRCDDLRKTVLISWLLFNSLSFSSIVSFTTQQDSHQASTPLLLSRHMGLWTAALGSAPSLPRLRTTASRVIVHKYLNTGSVISIFMKADVQFARAYMCACMLTPWLLYRWCLKENTVWAWVNWEITACCAHTNTHTLSLSACVRGEAVCSYTVCIQRKERQHQ